MKENEAFARDIIDIKIYSDRLIEKMENGRRSFTVQDQMLYMIVNEGPLSPRTMVDRLNIVKTNLALQAKVMLDNGLIIKRHIPQNNKEIEYVATEKGKKVLQDSLNEISSKFVGIDKELAKRVSVVCKDLKNLK